MNKYGNYLGKLLSSYFASIPIALLLSSTIFSLQQSQLKANSETQEQNYELQEKITKSRVNLLSKMPSFGFDNLIADLLYLDFVQYFGDYEARQATGNTLSSDYFSGVVQHDPRFVNAFLRLAPASTLYSGKPQESVNLLTQALKHLSPDIPKSYLLWTYKGVDELLFLGDTQAARESYAKAAEWASLQDDETSDLIGKRASETAQFLSSNPDSKKAQASSWMMIYSNARDEQVRNLAVQQIQSLGGELIIEGNTMTVKMPEDNRG